MGEEEKHMHSSLLGDNSLTPLSMLYGWEDTLSQDISAHKCFESKLNVNSCFHITAMIVKMNIPPCEGTSSCSTIPNPIDIISFKVERGTVAAVKY